MDKRIRYGMVGGGLNAFIGEVHRKAIAFDTRAVFVAGCFSSSPQRNAETAEAYGLDPARVYATYQEMVAAEAAREDKIDFVSICTPNDLHYDVAKAFLNAGVNVVCEKPLCFEIAQAEELEALAREKGLVFGVTYTYTGYTMPKVAKEMIAAGQIGDIVSVNAEYAQDWLLDEVSGEQASQAKNLSVWRTDPARSGIANCVGDIGTHMENMVHYLTGLQVKRLIATTNKFGHDLELNANIIVEYDNGVNGGYWCSQLAAGRANGLAVRIYGSKGSIEWEQHFPDYLKFTPKGEATQILSRGYGYLTQEAAATSRIPCGHPEGLYIAFANIYRNVITTIRKRKDGETPTAADLDFTNVTDGLAGVRFVHAVIQSAETGQWVAL